MIVESVKKELLRVSEEKGAKYTNVLSTNEYYGIRVPFLREIVNGIPLSKYKEFLDNNDFQPFELKLIQAYLIGKIKDLDMSLEYTDKFVPLISDWSDNDTICQFLKIAKKHQKAYWELLLKYAKSSKEFEQRFVAVMMLSHYLNDEYIDDVIKILDTLRNPKYYCKMGVAWAFATVMAKYPEKCFAYLETNSLDKWTHNKTIQKMIESFRVLDEHKDKLRIMKR